MHAPEEVHKALIDTAKTAQEYVGSVAYRHAVAMLDVLIESYSQDLQNVLPENLIKTQTAIRQTLAIRQTMSGASQGIPKI